MPSIYLDTRDTYCYGFNCSSSWSWARWVLFVLFILALICLFMSALRINKRRGQQGIEPIRGTAWITPPSYIQANQQRQEPYVPPYTEEANDNDMGYYDNMGAFHVNSKAKEAPAYHLNTLVPDQTGVSAPQAAVTSSSIDPLQSFNRDFNRYYGNTAVVPQLQQSTGDDVYDRPQGPPPAHIRS